MKRPPLPDINNLTPAQAQVAEAIISGRRGQLDGPLAVWLNSPALADHAQKLGAFCRYGTSLPPVLSELLILILAAWWEAGLEWAIHAPPARAAGLTDAVIDALAEGTEPAFTDEAQRVVYDFATEILQRRRVGDGAYTRAVDCLGEPAVVEMVGILGYYTLISMTIVAFEIPTPVGGENPFCRR